MLSREALQQLSWCESPHKVVIMQIQKIKPFILDWNYFQSCNSSNFQVITGALWMPMGRYFANPSWPPADMRFVQNFTLPDFQAKTFTLSISPNFNSFSDINTKNGWKWRNLHRWQKFYTAAGTDVLCVHVNRKQLKLDEVNSANPLLMLWYSENIWRRKMKLSFFVEETEKVKVFGKGKKKFLMKRRKTKMEKKNIFLCVFFVSLYISWGPLRSLEIY